MLESRRLEGQGFFAENFGQLRGMKVDIEEIPEASPCYNCASITVKALVDYRYPILEEGETYIEVGKLLPGYQCTSLECGVAYYDPETDEKFLSAVANDLMSFGDTSLQEILDSRYSIPEDTMFTPIPT